MVAAAAAVTLAAPIARADDDVRVDRACTQGSAVRLRVEPRDEDRLRVVIRVRTARRATWVVTVVHERRVALRTVRRAGATSTISVRLTLPDWPGRDTVIVRAIGPRGEICRAAATLAG